jgi:HD-like signal output (HDOD) protein
MSAITLEQVLANLRDLPTLPLVVTELISSFGQADVSIGELAAKVSNDQALTAKTLRLANSSFYGLQCKVRTIEQAIAVLGLDSVRALVTSAGIIGSFNGGAGGFDYTGFWRHAVGTALARRSRGWQITRVRLRVRLLHDIGRLVLITRFRCSTRRSSRIARRRWRPAGAECRSAWTTPRSGGRWPNTGNSRC